MIEPHITSNSVLSPYGSTEWTRQTRFVLWAGSGQAYAPGACPTVLSYPSTRHSHWKCLSGFVEAAPARLPADLPDFREFPPGAAIPGNSHPPSGHLHQLKRSAGVLGNGNSRELPGIATPLLAFPRISAPVNVVITRTIHEPHQHARAHSTPHAPAQNMPATKSFTS